MGNQIDQCCYSNDERTERSLDDRLEQFQFILSPEVGKQQYGSIDDDQQQAGESEFEQKALQVVKYTASTLATEKQEATKSSLPELLTEINEISNSSAYQDFYNIDFETSGIALDIAETE